MITKRAARWLKLALLAAGVLGLAGMAISPSYAANDPEIYVIQGLPGKNLDVAIDGITQRVDLVLTTPARRIELRYRLSGITARSLPSRAGRALTAISPLVEGVPKNFDVAMLVRGSTVHNIACPIIRNLGKQACSTGRPPNLRVNRNLPWSGAVIVVQFDLPMPQ